MDDQQRAEWLACDALAAYFIDNYCRIYDATARRWIAFRLWREQYETLCAIEANDQVVILKARQLGLTWLVLAYILWLLLFRPATTALLFSRRDREAVYLLDERLKGMYKELPDWMRHGTTDWYTEFDNNHAWRLSNGSVGQAFPTNAGDSYTASIVLVDEADLVPDLNKMMRAIKPTVDGGGKIILLSRSDKSKPQSEFKKIYRAAVAGLNDWYAIFLAWHVRPSRDAAWYDAQKRDILSRTTGLDDLHEQYPATDKEALAPKILDKRLSPLWLQQCDATGPGINVTGAPAIPGLVVYAAPVAGRDYVGGLDPAEGNPNSDESSLSILDKETGEQVAELAGLFQPSVMASYADTVCVWYNRADLLVERNNHGHAVLLWLTEYSDLSILEGLDGRAGWLSNQRGKTLMYDIGADAFRDGDTIIHSEIAYNQLQSIEGATLRAPTGENDDRADSYVLALVARSLPSPGWVDFARQQMESATSDQAQTAAGAPHNQVVKSN